MQLSWNRKRRTFGAMGCTVLVSWLTGCIGVPDEAQQEGTDYVGEPLICEGPSGEEAETYYPDALDVALEAFPELRERAGVDWVESCADAERVRAAHDALADTFEGYFDGYPIEPMLELPPLEDEGEQKVYRGQNAYNAFAVRINNSCSGVMITPDALLTAGHCLPQWVTTGSGAGTAMSVTLNWKRVWNGSWVTATSTFPNSRAWRMATGTLDVNTDLAVIKLSPGTSGTGLTPVRIWGDWFETTSNRWVDTYGWGARWNDESGGGELRNGEQNASAWVEDSGRYWFRATGESGGVRLCKGDSGGPAMVHNSNLMFVAGVFSTLQTNPDEACTKVGGKMRWTRLFQRISWIEDRLNVSCSKYRTSSGFNYFKCF